MLGVPMCIASDDPGYQEHTCLADDYFAACISWGLGVAELKALVLNSVTYSGLDERDKKELREFLLSKWNEFVKKYI